MDVSVDLEGRELSVGSTTVQLPNETIRQLREIADDHLDDATATAIVKDLIEDQIRPFLQATSRPVEPATIEQEIEEAFQPHLYSYHHRQTG
jgi:hypothetical protein